MGISVSDLSPWAQRQALQKYRNEIKRKPKPKPKPAVDEFESNLEREYYLGEILPRIQRGEIKNVDLHRKFDLLPASSYCGIRLPAAHYTPDFVITYADGSVEAVEVKSKKIRQLQGSYVYRRRLFIEKYARPNGWKFTEVIR